LSVVRPQLTTVNCQLTTDNYLKTHTKSDGMSLLKAI
jgi:hypothetical protein